MSIEPGLIDEKELRSMIESVTLPLTLHFFKYQ